MTHRLQPVVPNLRWSTSFLLRNPGPQLERTLAGPTLEHIHIAEDLDVDLDLGLDLNLNLIRYLNLNLNLNSRGSDHRMCV